LLHTHGTELFDLSQKNGCTICIEAAVGGGIPVVAAMTQALTGNRILSIEAILNGIGNITLSRMLDDRQPYEAILAQAQALGFAEADPTMDVDGTDAGQSHVQVA
jgi:homoserine dehydrogenase